MTGDAVTIRPADRRDLPAIVALYHQDEIHLASGLSPRAPSPAQLEAFDDIAADPNNHVYVADAGGAVVGTLQLTFIRQLTYGGCLVAQVESVFVDGNSRSRGIGRHLLTHAIAQAQRRGALRVQLTTNRARERAHRFYERLGFRASHHGMKLYLDTVKAP